MVECLVWDQDAAGSSPVAPTKTGIGAEVRKVAAYEDGILTREETIERLKVKKLYNQMTFSTEKALSYLKFIGYEEFKVSGGVFR